MSIDILSMICRQHEESHESDETEVHWTMQCCGRVREIERLHEDDHGSGNAQFFVKQNKSANHHSCLHKQNTSKTEIGDRSITRKCYSFPMCELQLQLHLQRKSFNNCSKCIVSYTTTNEKAVWPTDRDKDQRFGFIDRKCLR
jgi:hypothetical protein